MYKGILKIIKNKQIMMDRKVLCSRSSSSASGISNFTTCLILFVPARNHKNNVTNRRILPFGSRMCYMAFQGMEFGQYPSPCQQRSHLDAWEWAAPRVPAGPGRWRLCCPLGACALSKTIRPCIPASWHKTFPLVPLKITTKEANEKFLLLTWQQFLTKIIQQTLDISKTM